MTQPDPTGPTPEADFDADIDAWVWEAKDDSEELWKRRAIKALGLAKWCHWTEILHTIEHREYQRDQKFAGEMALRFLRVEVERLSDVRNTAAFAAGVAEGQRQVTEEWSKALGVAADVLLSMEAKRTALAEREARMEGTTDE